MPQFVDRTGQRHGRFTVVSFVGRVNKRSVWRCQCVCGNVRDVMAQSLVAGTSKSCGCLFLETRRARKGIPATHGQSKTRTYRIWCGIKKRCYNKNDHAYPRYGGRGITVHDRWRSSFENFVSDMGECPDGLTIEREDNDLGYEPGNCRWATYAEQNLNRRNSHKVVIGGEEVPLLIAARRQGINYSTAYYRHVLHRDTYGTHADRKPDGTFLALAKARLSQIETVDQLAWEE